MKKLIAGFAEQLKQATEISRKMKLSPVTNEIRNIVISGMGGSGIAGNMISDLISSEVGIPVIVNKNYFLPGFVNENTLVVISSYSGDTEETIKSFEEALDKKAKIICVTSGGVVLKLVKKNAIDCILLPPGLPPRAALGFSLVQLLYMLNSLNFISDQYKIDLQLAIDLIEKEEMNICRDAKETASMAENKLIVVYGTAGMESVALRFCQQLNENSKLLCMHNIFPELNHNELQGWNTKTKEIALIIFRNKNDFARIARRIDITKEIIGHEVNAIKEVYSKGNSQLERLLYLVHWGDWVSYFISELNGIDTMDVPLIRYLKSELAKT